MTFQKKLIMSLFQINFDDNEKKKLGVSYFIGYGYIIIDVPINNKGNMLLANKIILSDFLIYE